MSNEPAESERPRRRAVAIWLWTCVAALFALIVLGGVVRLTRSGLSITVWDPIMGAIPPLNHAAWERAFALYRESPEFRDVNQHMDLAGFQGIFWLEYLHRLLARSIGLLVAVPLGVFLWRRMLSKQLVRHLVVLFLLGGLQGLIGWLMVASGLVDAAHVSHYRLTLHLGMGFLLFGYAVLLAARQTFGPRVVRERTGLHRATLALTVLAAVTVLSGGLVAGLKSGHAFPTFPLIGGQLVPDGMWAAEPAWRNFVDNTITVQFQHRLLATIVFVSVCALWWRARKADLPRPARRAFDLALFVVSVQVALGISTLLLHVPVALAAAHQGNAALLLGVLLFANFALGRWPRGATAPESDPAPAGEAAALAQS
jgi:cytochrome c oxidase assembly protein subunit 15